MGCKNPPIGVAAALLLRAAMKGFLLLAFAFSVITTGAQADTLLGGVSGADLHWSRTPAHSASKGAQLAAARAARPPSWSRAGGSSAAASLAGKPPLTPVQHQALRDAGYRGDPLPQDPPRSAGTTAEPPPPPPPGTPLALPGDSTSTGGDTSTGSGTAGAGSLGPPSPPSDPAPQRARPRTNGGSGGQDATSAATELPSKLGMGSSSAAGSGKGKPLEFATQNTCGMSEEKLCYLTDMGKDVFALTEMHTDLSNSRCATALGNRLITSGPVNTETDKAGGVALLLSPRCAAAVSDSGTLDPDNASSARICWARINADPQPIFVVSVYWPHSKREQAPFREDTANELLKLLRDKVTKHDALVIMGDFNSRLARGDKGYCGPYTPHAYPDDGGVLMREIMCEFELRAANTYFQPSRKDARNTGSATYCQSKSYIQPPNQPYRADQAPSVIDYILVPRRFFSSVTNSSVDWRFSRHERGIIYDHGTVTMTWTSRVTRPPPKPPSYDLDAAPSISMSDLTPASRSTAESDMVPTDVTPQLSSEYANSEEPSVIPVVTAANPLSIREDPRSVLAPLVRSPRAVERKAPTLDVQDDNSRATTFGISQTSPIYQDSPINTDEKPTLPVPAPRVVTCDHVDAILPEGLPVSISSADQAHSNFAPTVFSPGSSKPLASNALNGRKHKYSLRSRVNTG